MPSKAGKITAGKARERIEGLRESISSRRHRLDQLGTRLDRSDVPDERLLAAKTRLERRIEQEEEQLEKLLRLLDRQDDEGPEESTDFEAEEEIEDLHRSFEEIRQSVAQLQTRIDSNPEVPRDLEGRLTACESRISRREAVDSELFARVMSLQTALDQERQAARRLARRLKDQEQNMEALREAVEDAVVTTVDLAERLEELAELSAPVDETAAPAWLADVEELRRVLAQSQSDLETLQRHTDDSLQRAARERDELKSRQGESDPAIAAALEAQSSAHAALLARLDSLEESLNASLALAVETSAPQASEELVALLRRLEALEKVSSQSAQLSPDLLGRLESLESHRDGIVIQEREATQADPAQALQSRLESLEAKLALSLTSRKAEPMTVPPIPTLESSPPTRKPAVFASPSERVGRRLAVFGKRLSRGS